MNSQRGGPQIQVVPVSVWDIGHLTQARSHPRSNCLLTRNSGLPRTPPMPPRTGAAATAEVAIPPAQKEAHVRPPPNRPRGGRLPHYESPSGFKATWGGKWKSKQTTFREQKERAATQKPAEARARSEGVWRASEKNLHEAGDGEGVGSVVAPPTASQGSQESSHPRCASREPRERLTCSFPKVHPE